MYRILLERCFRCNRRANDCNQPIQLCCRMFGLSEHMPSRRACVPEPIETGFNISGVAVATQRGHTLELITQTGVKEAMVIKEGTTFAHELWASVFKALSHRVRLFMFDPRSDRSIHVCEFTEMVGMDVSTLSRHLQPFLQVGLVRSRLICEPDNIGPQHRTQPQRPRDPA